MYLKNNKNSYWKNFSCFIFTSYIHSLYWEANMNRTQPQYDFKSTTKNSVKRLNSEVKVRQHP